MNKLIYLFKKLIDFILFSSLFVAICATLLVAQSVQLLELKYFKDSYYIFTFFGTVCSYNLHWYSKEKNIFNVASIKREWTNKNKNLIILFTLISFFVCVALLPFLWPHLYWLLLGGMLSLLYTTSKISYYRCIIIKYIRISKTIYLALTWTFITCIIPIIINGEHIQAAEFIFIAYRFLFMLILCILFDFRDREKDRANDLITTVNLLNRPTIKLVYHIVLILGVAVATLWGVISCSSILVVVNLYIPLFFLYFLYEKASISRNDYLYYFLIDGMMIFSWALTAL